MRRGVIEYVIPNEDGPRFIHEYEVNFDNYEDREKRRGRLQMPAVPSVLVFERY